MLRRIIIWSFWLSIIIAIWKVSGGDLGAAATNAWHFAVRLLDTTSDWLLTIWNNVNA